MTGYYLFRHIVSSSILERSLRCREVEQVSKAPKLHDVNKRHLSKELGTLLVTVYYGLNYNLPQICVLKS